MRYKSTAKEFKRVFKNSSSLSINQPDRLKGIGKIRFARTKNEFVELHSKCYRHYLSEVRKFPEEKIREFMLKHLRSIDKGNILSIFNFPIPQFHEVFNNSKL